MKSTSLDIFNRKGTSKNTCPFSIRILIFYCTNIDDKNTLLYNSYIIIRKLYKNNCFS